jgi:hypothetical protein
MNRVETPQSRVLAAAARADITPPVGIYHRMWGAALHDRATGVHRPLEATLLWLAPVGGDMGESRLIVSLDHCILDSAEMQALREAMAAAVDVPAAQIHIALSHTHGSGWMSRSRSHLPGGELIGPYLDGLAQTLAELAQSAQPRLVPATIVYGIGRCALAAHRDFLDTERGAYVCGFNPGGPADDTLVVARVTSEAGDTLATQAVDTLATIVNYACHPTTLAWENTLISPDWVGAMRQAVESHAGGVCLFLQGASGDLGPREGFVGDVRVADRNGEQVGYAALAALAALPAAGTEFVYRGPVVSGATLGKWEHRPSGVAELSRQGAWRWESLTVELPYRHDLPTIEATTAEREHWLAEEAAARAAGDEERLRTARAQVEQRSRQLARLGALAPGRSWPLPVEIGLVGDAVWVLVPGELYQVVQQSLRERLAPRVVIVSTVTNDWQPGYIPPASAYGYGIYQEIIAATAPGALEVLIEAVWREISRMTAG